MGTKMGVHLQLTVIEYARSSIQGKLCEWDSQQRERSMQYDVIVVGGGHNGLTCACYLQRAGLRVLVLERRSIVGGAVCTETMFGGYRIDVGSSAHIMIHLTPVIRELELERYGLDYIDMDPFAFYPLSDGSGAIEFWRDLDRTCASIERISPRDAEAY